jgi:serine protease Do
MMPGLERMGSTWRRGLFATALALGSTAASGQGQSDLSDAFERVSASVVAVTVETTDTTTAATNGDQKRPKVVQATGFIFTSDGRVITSAHALDKASKITVVFHDGSHTTARIVGKDALTGVGLLRVTPALPLAPVHFANSEQAKTGQPVFAVANSFGLRGTLASGIIAAAGRDADNVPYPLQQTDITIYPGLPGAPVFNLKGDVVAMASSAYATGGHTTPIGFAVPSNIVKDIADKLERHGSIERGYLGLKMRKATEQEANSLGIKSGAGLIIVSVLDGAPAASTGLTAGDALVALNGRPIAGLGAFVRTIFDLAPDTEVTLGTIQKQRHADIRVKLGRVSEQTVTTTSAPVTDKASGSATGCSRYMPSADMTVSVPCDE